MMGSDTKVDIIKQELRDEGFDEKSLDKIYMPIGLHIFSKTAQEIAVSIAAEIIRKKINTCPPAGRADAQPVTDPLVIPVSIL